MIVEEPAHKYYTSLSPSAFLKWERKADSKHEYASGTIISMAGASPAHNLILSNLITLAGTFLRGITQYLSERPAGICALPRILFLSGCQYHLRNIGSVG